MGEGKLLAVAAAVIAALAPGARAQGPAYREHWAFLHLEHRRAQLLGALAGKDAAAQARVAQALLAPCDGAPFVPVARALAELRGCEPDAAFVLRATTSAYVLPEVCDPDAQNEACRTTNVSIFVPYAIDAPGTLSFDVAVDDAGRTVWSKQVTENTTIDDLRAARATAQVPCAELPDGSYRVTVRTRIDGKLRDGDPILSWPFHVRRGYQHRAEEALIAAKKRIGSLPPAQCAVLDGSFAAVARAYEGEAFAVASDAAGDLQRLERVLANLDAGKSAADGIAGDLQLALPVGNGQSLRCVLRRAGAEPRPLVVVAAGTPAWDTAMNRPSLPVARDPAWTAHELATFGVADRWHVAFVESPGGGRDFASALRAALPLLREFAPTGDTLPLLVCEREAATIVGLHAATFAPLVSGLVLVGGGALTGAALDALGPLPVRLARAHGPTTEPLVRVIDHVARQQAAGKWRGDVAWLSDASPPWCLALPLHARDVETFARTLFTK